MFKPRVLHLDDERDFLVLFSLTFEDTFDITSTENSQEALGFLQRETFDAVITDYEMADINGLELLKFVKDKFPGVPVIFYTGQGNEEIVREAFISGASDYYVKDIAEFAHKEKIANSIMRAIEKRKAEEALRESERKHKLIFEKSLGLYFLIDLHWNILDANETFLAVMQQSKENLVGKCLLDYLTEESRELVKTRLVKDINGEDVKQILIQFLVSGEIRTILTGKNAIVFRDEKGEIESILISGIDLTDLKMTQDALQKNEELLRAITYGATTAIAILDQNGKITYWNSASEEMFGFSASESIGQLFYKITLPKRYHSPYRLDFEAFRETEKKVFTGRTIALTAIRRNGEEFPIKLSLCSVRIEGTWHAVGVIRDISNQKQAIEALRDSEDRYKNLIEGIKDAVFTLSLDGRFLTVNPAFEHISGWTKSEIVGVSFSEFVHPDDMATALQVYNKTIEGESHPYSEFRIKLKDGSYLISEVKVAPLFKNGRITGAVGIGQDITLRKKMEQELINKNTELSDFAHTISHDLKSEITTIYGYLDIIKNNPALFDKYCDKAMNKALNMVNFVDNLLKLSRAGRVINKKKEIDPEELVRVIFENKIGDNIQARLHIPEKLPSIWGDPERIGQLFTNIIKNSIRYRDMDKEVLELRVESFTDISFTYLIFRDNGIGIAPEKIQAIFRPGYTSDKNKGTGFGLPIVQKIVEAHGGKIWAESEGEKKGAAFFIKLPIE
jgi:PAS domain S-box-containing protein